MTATFSNGKATTVKKFFNRETSVDIDIKADSSIIWALLTNASDYPRWNSTVLSIEGEIKKGDKIKLRSVLDPKRVFKLQVKEMSAETNMVWGDAMGNRVYTLKPIDKNVTRFSMSEKIGGPLFPLFSGLIPSFDQTFEQFARDLKNEAETISQTK